MRGLSFREKIYRGTLIQKFVICLFVIFLLPAEGLPVNFSINPIRIFFEGGKKTDMLTVKNESAKKVALQISAVAWTQDEKADNVYLPTEDILFFPKLVEIPPGEEKIIRIGTRVSRGDTEKTYRLFLEEISDNNKMETTSVRMLMKVGVPVFISPLKSAASAVIGKMELSKGSLRVNVKNEGNIHFIMKSMKLEGRDDSGKEIYTAEQAGGYLHHGKTKDFTFGIPEGVCRKIKTLNLHIDTDRLTTGKQIEIAGEMCGP
jgi:fimbrial chaperone protein